MKVRTGNSCGRGESFPDTQMSFWFSTVSHFFQDTVSVVAKHFSEFHLDFSILFGLFT